MTPNVDHTAYLERGREMTMTFEASDARLAGAVTCASERLVDRDGSFVEAEDFTIVNESGSWIGQSTGHVLAQPPADVVVGGAWPVATGPDHREVVALRGEGDYEGLQAVISADSLAAATGHHRRHLRRSVAVGARAQRRVAACRREWQFEPHTNGTRPRSGRVPPCPPIDWLAGGRYIRMTRHRYTTRLNSFETRPEPY